MSQFPSFKNKSNGDLCSVLWCHTANLHTQRPGDRWHPGRQLYFSADVSRGPIFMRLASPGAYSVIVCSALSEWPISKWSSVRMVTITRVLGQTDEQLGDESLSKHYLGLRGLWIWNYAGVKLHWMRWKWNFWKSPACISGHPYRSLRARLAPWYSGLN